MKSSLAPRAGLAKLLLVLVLAVLALVILTAVALWLVSSPPPRQGSPTPRTPPAPRAHNPHLLMGNPSGATADPRARDNYLLSKSTFALSYNNDQRTLNWVSWRLSREDLGDATRGQFYPDPDLPAGFVRVTPRDYVSGGFDRGHMCPHADRDAGAAMSRTTFAMTNIVPQSPNLNQNAWEQLESYCRSLVEKEDKTLYIVCGPHGTGGEGREGVRETIGTQRVTVPEKCWKVIMVLDGGPGDDLARVNSRTRLIAVIMPNTMSVRNAWAGYRVPVKNVERLTGYRFFDRAPAATLEPLKEAADRQRIPSARPPRRGERRNQDAKE